MNAAEPLKTVEITQKHTTYTDVFAAVLRCTFAGVGLGVVAAIALIAVGVNTTVSLLTALALCGVIAGAMIFWTFARDPIINAWEWEQLRLENDALEDAVEYLEDKIDTLATRNHYLEGENQRLTVQVNGTQNYVPKAAASDPVRRDAQVLIDTWAAGGYVAPTQRQMMEHGWSQARYASARMYLIARDVIDSGNRGGWKVDTKEAAEVALD